MQIQAADTAAIDQLIRDMDAVMNGAQPGAVPLPDYDHTTMEKLRALVRGALSVQPA